jgi:methyl-accepting chemotaxis protein
VREEQRVGNLTIYQRFLLIIGLLFITLAAVSGAQVLVLRQAVLEERQIKVREMVDVAKSILATYEEQAKAGKMSAEAARRGAFSAIGAMRWGPFNDYVTVNDAGSSEPGLTYVHANPKYINVNRWGFKDGTGRLLIQDIVATARAGGGYLSYVMPRGSGGAALPKLAWIGAFGEGDSLLAIQAGAYIDDIDAAVLHRSVWVLAGGLTGLLIAGVTALGIGRGVARPLGRLCGVMDRIAGGDLAAAVPFVARRNEVGRIARSLDVFKTSLQEAARHRSEQAEARSRAEAEKWEAVDAMAATIESDTSAAMATIRQRTAGITATTEEIRSSAGRTADAAETAGAAAGQALATAETVAGAAEQLSASISEIGVQMSHSARVVGRAVSASAETRSTIEALNERVAHIGSVAAIIGEIAARTNLLALNATIEAARAGDAGKGFAVVASEVKQLATQTAQSTAEIGRHIGAVRTATDASVAAVARIETTITEINAIAGSIAVAVEQQGAATAEIARNVAETASAANALTGRIDAVSAEAGGTGRHVDAVRANTSGLNEAMEDLQHSVTRAIRASKANADRRGSERHAMDVACMLAVAGDTQAARLLDLSAGGARLRTRSVLPIGSRGVLTVDGVGVALAFVVKASSAGSLHLAFELDAATAERFRDVPERMARQWAA